MKQLVLRIILIIMIILTSTLIFGFSNQDAKESSGVSKKVTKFIISKIPSLQEKEQSEREKIENQLEGIIRKIAHYLIYTFLGLQIMLFISTYNLKELNRIAISLISGIIYATTDEIHQGFIPGRAAQFTDIMLDSLGILTGIFISLFLIELVKTTKKAKS